MMNINKWINKYKLGHVNIQLTYFKHFFQFFFNYFLKKFKEVVWLGPDRQNGFSMVA